jgi:hypothetical protein
MNAQHTPGRVCGECEGFCLQPVARVDAGVEVSLRIGQRVRHRDYRGKRVTGTVRGLCVDSDRALQADIVLDAPIVIEARSSEDREIEIWHQHVPAHELAPFDDRDDVISDLLAAAAMAEALLARQRWIVDGSSTDPEAIALIALRAAIAKATGAAS